MEISSSKKIFLITLLLIPGSMFGMLSKMNRLKKTSKLNRSLRRLTRPSAGLQRSMQRFMATRRAARKNNLVTKSMVPAFLQKRLVKNDINKGGSTIEKLEKLCFGVVLFSSGFLMLGGFELMQLSVEMFDPVFDSATDVMFMLTEGATFLAGGFGFLLGGVMPTIIIKELIDLIKEEKESKKLDSIKTTK